MLLTQRYLTSTTGDAERVRDDPWKVLVAVMLLNKTTGMKAIPIFWQLMQRWPSAEAMSKGKCCLHLVVLSTSSTASSSLTVLTLSTHPQLPSRIYVKLYEALVYNIPVQPDS